MTAVAGSCAASANATDFPTIINPTSLTTTKVPYSSQNCQVRPASRHVYSLIASDEAGASGRSGSVSRVRESSSAMTGN